MKIVDIQAVISCLFLQLFYIVLFRILLLQLNN